MPSFDLHNLSTKQKRALSLSIMLAAGFYLALVFVGGHEVVLAAASQLGMWGWLLLLVCSMGNYALRFVRWHYYLQRLGYLIQKKRHLHYYMAGFALTTTPGKAGETIRSLYLKSHGVTYPHSLATFLTERFLDVVIITFLASLALLSFAQYGPFVLIAMFILIVLLQLLRNRLFIVILEFIRTKCTKGKIHSLASHLVSLLNTTRDLLKPKVLYTGLMLGFVAWSIQGIAFYFILVTLNAEIGLYTAMAIYAISLLAGALSFIPGGIGATETVMGLLLIATGVDTGLALAIPIISRVSTLWFAVALGLLSTAYLGLKGVNIEPVET